MTSITMRSFNVATLNPNFAGNFPLPQEKLKPPTEHDYKVYKKVVLFIAKALRSEAAFFRSHLPDALLTAAKVVKLQKPAGVATSFVGPQRPSAMFNREEVGSLIQDIVKDFKPRVLHNPALDGGHAKEFYVASHEFKPKGPKVMALSKNDPRWVSLRTGVSSEGSGVLKPMRAISVDDALRHMRDNFKALVEMEDGVSSDMAQAARRKAINTSDGMGPMQTMAGDVQSLGEMLSNKKLSLTHSTPRLMAEFLEAASELYEIGF